MSLFGGIKNNWKKSEAAAIIQTLLENSQKNMGAFGFSHDPAKAATSLVQNAWEAMTDVFSGKFGQRPHKLTTAAIALAYGIQHTTDEDNQSQFLIALGNILNQVEINGSFYPFNNTDNYLLERASRVFATKANKEHPYDDILFKSEISNKSTSSSSASKGEFERQNSELAVFKACQEGLLTQGTANVCFKDEGQKHRYLDFMAGAVGKLSLTISDKNIGDSWAAETIFSEAFSLFGHKGAMLHLESYRTNNDKGRDSDIERGCSAMHTFLYAEKDKQGGDEFTRSCLEMYSVVNQIPLEG